MGAGDGRSGGGGGGGLGWGDREMGEDGSCFATYTAQTLASHLAPKRNSDPRGLVEANDDGLHGRQGDRKRHVTDQQLHGVNDD